MNLSDSHELLERMVANAQRLCEQTILEADALGVQVHSIGGATVLDFATDRIGTIAAGIRLAEICLSDLAKVEWNPGLNEDFSLPFVRVTMEAPLIACIASQYAGWPFSVGKYFAMCSGPARVNRGKEPILSDYHLTGRFSPAIGIFETHQLPGLAEINAFAEECHVSPQEVILCVARTASFPGSIQVVARSVETTLHKLHELQFDLRTIGLSLGTAPVPPIPDDDLTALGWTNDAILYGSTVTLLVNTSDGSVDAVADRLPSSSSPDFGEPFLNIFNRYERDFYKIDKHLFSPANVWINNGDTGRITSYGATRFDILRTSFHL